MFKKFDQLKDWWYICTKLKSLNIIFKKLYIFKNIKIHNINIK